MQPWSSSPGAGAVLLGWQLPPPSHGFPDAQAGSLKIREKSFHSLLQVELETVCGLSAAVVSL